MNRKVEIDKELLYEVLGTLQNYLILIEEGIEQPDKNHEIKWVKQLQEQLSKAGNLE